MSPRSEGFVGRTAELARLDREIQGAVEGEGCVVLVTGEAGVGKTWLVRETLARRQAGNPRLRSSWARCTDAIGVPAYWPWRELLGADFPRDVFACGDGSTEPMDRFERLHAAIEAVGRAASDGPLVLVIDDLQWADADSILLLDALVASIGERALAVVATVRDDVARSEISEGIAALQRHRAVRSLALQGWSLAETARFLEKVQAEVPEPETVRAYHRSTAGNPYFVDELLRHRLKPGVDGALTGEGQLPGGIQRLIAARVAASDAALRELLVGAAVIGRDFSLALLQRLLGGVAERSDRGLSLLDRALAARLLEPAEAPGHLRFVHGLVPGAILMDCPTHRLAVLHGRLAELLAKDPALGAGGVAEVARHFSSAARALPELAERAVHFSRLAGWEASTQGSHDLAARHFRDAVAAQASLSDGSDAALLDRAALLTSLGHSLALADPLDSEAALGEAEALAEARLGGEDGERAAQILALALVIRAQETRPATADACRREAARADAALARLGSGQEVLRAHLLSALTSLLIFEEDRERPAQLAREAVRIADEQDDPLAQGRALEALHWALLDHPSAQERLEVASRVLRRAERLGNDHLAATARYWLYFDLLELGRVEDAEAELATIEQIAQRLGQPRRLHQALTLRAGLAIQRGRLEQAEVLARQALELGRRAAVAESEVFHEAVMTRVAFERDDAEAISNQETLASPIRFRTLPQSSTPVIRSWQGRQQAALENLEWIRTRGFHLIPRGPDWLATLYTLGWGAIFLEDREACAQLYTLLRSHSGHTVVFYLGALSGSMDRLLANLASKIGRYEEAQQHFRDALRSIERTDARTECAHLFVERAELRIALGARADDAAVLDDLRQALVRAREVGSRRVERRVAELAPRLVEATGDAQPTPRAGRFLHRGDHWQVGIGATARETPDARGLHFIAALLTRPGEEILSTTLVAEVTGELDVPIERARLRVTQRVRQSLGRLRELDPELASHLAHHLRTGNYCAYLPPAADRVGWKL